MSEQPTDQFSEQPLPPRPHAEAPESGDEAASQQQASIARIAELQERGFKGANWFFWVAGLSVVNSIIMHGGGGTYFVVGLGVTLFVDAIAKLIGEQNPELDSVLKIVGIGFAVLIAIVVTGFGWLARRGVLPVFAIGMILYLLDGLLFLLFQDLMSVGFHGFALFWMWNGFSAFRQMNVLQAELRARLD